MEKIYVLLTTLFIINNCQAQQYKLSLDLKKGETYTYDISLNMNLLQSINGTDMNVKMNMDSKISYKIIALKDSIYEIEVRYGDLTMKMDLPSGVQEFSSQKKDTKDIFSTLLTGLQKNSFMVKVGKSGKVLEVSNTETLFKEIEDFPGMSALQKASMTEMLSKSYGEKAFRENMKMSMITFPTEKIGIGDSWTVKNTVETGVKTGISTTYQLREVNATNYIITAIAKIASLEKDLFVDQAGVQMRSDLVGSMNSTFTIGKKTGWIVAGNINQQIRGNTYLKASETMPDDMTMPMEVSSKVTIVGH